MEQPTLKKLRCIYPGIVVLVIAIVLLYDNISDAIKMFSNLDINIALPVIVIFFAGLIYYALNIRDIIWKPAKKRIGENINSRLLKIAGIDPATELSETQRNSIRDSVFFHIVDKDPSLTCKAYNVRFNGFMLTSAIDNILIIPLGMISFVIKACLQRQALSVFFWVLLIIELISGILYSPLLNKHIVLSNEQIDIIKNNYEDECKNRITTILRGKN